MSIVALNAAHAAKMKAVAEQRSFYADNEGKEITEEMKATEARFDAEIDKQDERIGNLLRSMKLDEEANAALVGSVDAGGREDRSEDGEPSDEDRLRALANGEMRSHTFYENRDNVTLNKGTATDGQEVVPTDLFNQLTDFLRENATVMLDGGAKMINTQGGADLQFPTVTSHSAASIVAELGTIGKDSPQFSSVTLGAFKYAFLTALSNELVQDETVNIIPWLISQGGEALARGVGAHLISGSGSGQPNGIFTAATTGVTAASATAITADELLDLQHSIATPYRRNARWIMKDSTLKIVRKLKDGDNQYLWRPGLTAREPDSLLGGPVFTDDACPAATTGLDSVLYGDVSGYVVRTAKGAEVTRSDEFGYDTDSVFWRFITRVDGDLVDTNAVRVLTQG